MLDSLHCYFRLMLRVFSLQSVSQIQLTMLHSSNALKSHCQLVLQQDFRPMQIYCLDMQKSSRNVTQKSIQDYQIMLHASHDQLKMHNVFRICNIYSHHCNLISSMI